MIKAILTGQRLVALFVFGWVMLNYPLLSVFNVNRAWLGIPVLYLYVFGAWAVLVALMAWIAER